MAQITNSLCGFTLNTNGILSNRVSLKKQKSDLVLRCVFRRLSNANERRVFKTVYNHLILSVLNDVYRMKSLKKI